MRTGNTAHEILERTIETIAAHGESAVRVQDLADTVGVAVTSLYHFYGNREGLIEAAQAERYVRGLRAAQQSFADDVRRCGTADDFRTVMTNTMRRLSSADSAPDRMTLVNALGSAHGRPQLAAAIAEMHSRSVVEFAAIFAGPQESGWIRPSLDLAAFSAWYVGNIVQRAVIDLGDTGVDDAAWNQISHDATLAVLFGDVPTVVIAASA
ncbi:MAG: helix-turn-helix domain-containing protein [Ilumatobacteraceae bacterium]